MEKKEIIKKINEFNETYNDLEKKIELSLKVTRIGELENMILIKLKK